MGADVPERGDIYLLHRPRVGEEDPDELADVQRFSEDESRRRSEIVEGIGLDLDGNHPEPLFEGEWD